MNIFAENLRETLDEWDVSQAEVSRNQPALTHTCWRRNLLEKLNQIKAQIIPRLNLRT